MESAATLVAAGVPAGVVSGIAFLLPGVTSDGQSDHVRWRDGLVFGLLLLAGAGAAVLLERLPRPRITPALRRGLLAAAVVAVGRRRRLRRREGRGVGGGRKRRRPAGLDELELPLRLVASGLAGVPGPRARRHRRRLVPPREPSLPFELPRLHDRAAQPAPAVPRRGRHRRARPARAQCGFAPARQPRSPRPRARACARPACVPPALARRHRLGLRRRLGARVPRRGRARREADRAPGVALPDARRGRRGAPRVRRAVPALARRALVRAGGGVALAAARDHAGEAGSLGRPAPRRSRS